MSRQLLGIHHVTAISSNPQQTIDFYTDILGLRLVKLTVNYDDPTTYHLYFGDETGQPGTVLTFFPWPEAPQGRHGTGQATTISFAVPRQSFSYWLDRFRTRKISFRPVLERFGDKILRFNDPDGQDLELVEPKDGDERPSWRNGPIPIEYSIRGFHSLTLEEKALEDTESLLLDTLGFRQVQNEEPRFRYVVGKEGSGAIVDVLSQPQDPRGFASVGTVHHVAFRVRDDEEQKILREEIRKMNPSVTPVINRNYFHSIYFREPGGVLFEAATDPPGFMIDESREELGTALSLPSWLEPQRERIVRALPKVRLPQLA